MSYRDKALAARASLAKSGAQVVVAWQTTPDYVPGEPEPQPVQVSFDAPGVVVEYASREIGTQPDSLIRAGDRNLLLAACDEAGEPLLEPPFGAAVTLVDGSLYKVANVKSIAPAGVAVMFDITIRR